MTEITKEQLVFTRAEDGSLISQEITLKKIEGKHTPAKSIEEKVEFDELS